MAGLALVSLVPAVVLANNTPRFNQLDGDREFLMGRNLTQNQVDYADPVSATDGDVVRVSFYYHNNALQTDGQPGSTAINTKVTLNLPTADALSHYITGTVGADNAETVSGTIVNGQEVGQPGLTVNTDQSTTVSLVPGSVRFYPAGSTNPVQLPNGQSGDEIVTNSGLNLGDIQGCWQFAGFVTVDIRVNPAGQPDIVRSKTAINQSQGGALAKDVNAKAGDTLVYTLTTRNTGNRPAAAVAISDDLADVLEYATFVSASDNGVLQGNTINYAATDIAVGQTITRTFSVQVKPTTSWPATGNFIMSNTYGNRVDVPVQPPAIIPGLSIDKQVKNITQSFDYRNEVTAHRGDLVEFRLKITNTSSVLARNVMIKDLLPTGLNFQPGSIRLDRNGNTYAIADDAVSTGGFKLDTPLKAQEVITVYLRAKVGTEVADGQKIRNVATTEAEAVGQVADDANVIAEVAPEVVVSTATTAIPTTPAGPVLPISGPADMILFLVTGGLAGSTGLRHYRAKKALVRASRQVAVL